MLTCRRASERLSRALDGTLGPGERLGLWAHLLLCGPCCRYRQQLRTLHEAASRAADHPPAPAAGLSDAARGRIAGALERHLADGG